jgi:hypothetical protein
VTVVKAQITVAGLIMEQQQMAQGGVKGGLDPDVER